MKRVFGKVEAVFDMLYMITALILSLILLFSGSSNTARILSGIMGLVLVIGDSFHLVPRITVIMKGSEDKLHFALGRGKQITSITMTVFYMILWHIGLLVFNMENMNIWSYVIYFLAASRIVLCLLPQNKWTDIRPPVIFGIIRNIPFLLLGFVVSILFFLQRGLESGIGLMWLAIVLSFAFYLPVVILSDKYPRLGILMLPKTCAYIWMLVMCTFL
jgi:hypothetical protein